MNHSKKIVSIVTLVLLTIMSINAFDYGAELSNTGGIKNTSELAWYTDHKGTLWLSIPFDRNNKNTLSVEGSAYASKPTEGSTFNFFMDLDLFRLSLVPYAADQTKVSVDLGRIPVVDITGFILNQSSDGTEFHGSLPFGNIDLFAGYTGFLNVRKGGALMSDDDYADANTDAMYAFGSSRIISKITIQIPHLIGNIDVITEALGQYDMRRYTQSDYSELVDTLYGTLSITGPILDILYYSTSGTIQAGVLENALDGKKYSETSLIASARLDFFPVKNNQLFAQCVFSPANNDMLTSFLPITFQSAGTLYTNKDGYANLIRPSIGWYFNPFPVLNIDLGGKMFIHPLELTDGAGRYDSSELTAGASIKATSDLRFRIDSVMFLPYKSDIQYQASLKAILDL